MKREISLILIVLFCSSGVLCRDATAHLTSSVLEDGSKPSSKNQITIRNMTEQVVHYTYKPANSDQVPIERILMPGVIDYLTSVVPLDLDYKAGGMIIITRIDPGQAYTFRYNEEDGLELFQGSHGREDAPDLAPFVTTPMVVVEKMLELARITEHDVLYDLGCGDGRIVITAAKTYGIRGVGIDIVPERIKECRSNAAREGVEDLVEFRLEDATKSIFSEATILTMYLLPESNALLRPHLEKQLRPGARVVSHNYHVSGWEAKEIHFVTIKDEHDQEHYIYVYII